MATYARETVREYLHIRGNGSETREEPFAGFRVSSERVAQSLVLQHPSVFSDSVKDAITTRKMTLQKWLNGDVPAMQNLAEFARLFKLSAEDVELFILAAAPALDPSIRELYAYVWNDVRRTCADIGFL